MRSKLLMFIGAVLVLVSLALSAGCGGSSSSSSGGGTTSGSVSGSAD